MGRGVVNAPLEKVQAFLGDFTTREQYDPMCTVRGTAPHSVVTYVRLKQVFGCYKHKFQHELDILQTVALNAQATRVNACMQAHTQLQHVDALPALVSLVITSGIH